MEVQTPVPAPITDILIPAYELRDPTWDAAERERLWPRVWQMARRESDLTEAGQFVNYEILDEPIPIDRTGEAP